MTRSGAARPGRGGFPAGPRVGRAAGRKARLGVFGGGLTLGMLLGPVAVAQMPAAAGGVAARDTVYRVLAGAESEDEVALIEFRPCAAADSAESQEPRAESGSAPTAESRSPACGARVARTYVVGLTPADIESPHGVVAAPDGRSFYVSIAHGRPTGWLQQYDVATGRLLRQVELGMFPATLDISPGGDFVYAINFNFEDPAMAPSSLSVVDGMTMTEVARPVTCRMPHGSRVNPQGTRHYSGCMMNDLLVEVDTRSFQVTRLFDVAPGHARGVPVPPAEEQVGRHGGMAGAHPMQAMAAHDLGGGAGALPMSNACSPTWAQPSADGRRIYVACNKSAEVVEVDAGTWTQTRRWKTPPAPYNMAVTPDGRLLVITQKGPGSTSVWRLRDTTMLVDIKGVRGVASGVVVSPDSRYAFTTLEGVGGEPGTIEIIDLVALRKVATVDIGKQAGGIAILP